MTSSPQVETKTTKTVELKKPVTPKKRKEENKKPQPKKVEPVEVVAESNEKVNKVDEDTQQTDTQQTDTQQTDVSRNVSVSVRAELLTLVESKNNEISKHKRELVSLKKLIKQYDNEVKELSKRGKRRKSPTNENYKKKTPSGIHERGRLSDELYTFLERYDVKRGELIARTGLIKYINQYVKEHNLQHPDDKTIIIPDKTLVKLYAPPSAKPRAKSALEDKETPVHTFTSVYRDLEKHWSKADKTLE